MHKRETLQKLSHFLNDHHYAAIIDTLTAGRLVLEPWPIYPEDRVKRIAEPFSSILQLFLIGNTIPSPEKILGQELALRLSDLKILVQENDGRWSLGNRCIIPYMGVYLISDLWRPGTIFRTDQVWLSKHSFCMARLQPLSSGKRVLDLGTGNGIQAIVAAACGAYVNAVDINSRALEITDWNRHLNGVDGRVEVFLGDLYEPVKEKEFDCIIAYTPFLPLISERSKNFTFTEVKTDGLQIFRRVLNGLSVHLSPRGTAMIHSEGFGDANGPNVVNELQQIGERQGWMIDLLITGQHKAKEEFSRMARSLSDSATAFKAVLENFQPDITHYYSFVIFVRRADNAGQVRVLVEQNSWAQRLIEARSIF